MVFSCVALFASGTIKEGMRIYKNGGFAEDYWLSDVDSVKFFTAEIGEDGEIMDNRDYVVDGALVKASFKVSDSTSVYFSQGNLQFNAMQGSHAVLDSASKVAGTWRFAKNQYDVVGEDNALIADDYSGWIDLFSWGTSGWNSGAKAYQPWDTLSGITTDYNVGNVATNSLLDSCAKADWGIYNAISNGGNEPNKWRTMTGSEWQYLFKNNSWTLGYVRTNVNDSVLCFMLIPETFTAPNGTTLTVISTTTNSATKDVSVPTGNSYSAVQFESLEKLGVVALPCAGSRNGIEVYDVNTKGYYWTSSATDWRWTASFRFYNRYVCSNDYSFRVNGFSVRLVQTIQKESK